MWKIYQNHTVHNDGYGDCFNACIASILEIPLAKASVILPNTLGNWSEQWRVWLAEKGRALKYYEKDQPPAGYSIATVYTQRVYPEGHPKSGKRIAHACVAFDGIIVHDPYPIPSERGMVEYYQSLHFLSEAAKLLHDKKMEGGVCIHGYKSSCDVCPIDERMIND